jgi:hypothetical protein
MEGIRMAITPEEIMAVLENHREELVAHMVEETKTEITRKINWTLAEEVNKIVKDFITTEIAPEIKAQLVENKPAILKAIAVMTEQFSMDLTEALLAQARENLNQSWKRNEIMKAMFN